jgi:putative hydrolase of the HAD superfamily
MPLAAVTFDLWETLIADSPAQDGQRSSYRVREIGRLLAEHGLPVAAADLELAHGQIWEECSRSWQQATDRPFKQQMTRFLELARPGLSAAVPGPLFQGISECYATAALKFPPRLIEGAQRTLAWLRGRGLKTGLICNTGRTPGFALRELLKGFGLLGCLDIALFSDETVIRKPDPGIFLQALSLLGADPGQALHVGDSWANDVQGAVAAGMRAVWIAQVPGGDASPVTCITSVASLPEVIAKLS